MVGGSVMKQSSLLKEGKAQPVVFDWEESRSGQVTVTRESHTTDHPAARQTPGGASCRSDQLQAFKAH